MRILLTLFILALLVNPLLADVSLRVSYKEIKSFDELLKAKKIDDYDSLSQEDKNKLKYYERQRRYQQYATIPWTAIPGKMFLYKTKDTKSEKLEIPTAEAMRCLVNRGLKDTDGSNMGTWAKVYSLYHDKVGYIETMQSCAYKGVTVTDFSAVNFPYYKNSSGATMTHGSIADAGAKYTFPLKVDWGDDSNKADDTTAVTPTTPTTQTNDNATPTVPPIETPEPPTVDTNSTDTNTTDTQTPTTTTNTSNTPPVNTTTPTETTEVDEPVIQQISNIFTQELHLREQTSLESTDLITIPVGASCGLIRNEGSWCRVKYEGKIGYVRSYYVGMPSSITTNIPGRGVTTTPTPTTSENTPPTAGTPGSAPVTAEGPQDSSEITEILQLTNAEREKLGKKALVLDDAISRVAQLHAEDMAKRNYFNHTNPDGLSPFQRMRNAGISYFTAAENIAINRSAKGVVGAWMNSPGHKANILNGSMGKIGIGAYKGYYVQCFTN